MDRESEPTGVASEQPNDNDGAELLRRAMRRCFNMSSEIASLKTVLEAGRDAAVERLSREDRSVVDAIYAMDELFQDRSAFEAELPRDKMAKLMTETKVHKAGLVAASAALVFAHSAVDAVALDCCRAITLLIPVDCRGWVEDRKFKLADLLAKSADDLLRRALDARLNELDGQGLIAKTDFIYRMCAPPDGGSTLADYTWDRDRLKRVDAIRHDVVHKQGIEAVRSLSEGDQTFLVGTGMHLTFMTMKSFNIKLSPGQMMSAFAGSSPLK